METLARGAKAVAAILIASAIVAVLTKYWPTVRQLAGSLDYRWLALALALCVIYRVLNAAGWGLVLRSLGHAMPIVHGTRLWLIAETMRWLPGSIWGYCSRVYQAQRSGVPTLAATLSMPLELAITVAAWGVVALAGGRRAFDLIAQATAEFPSHWGIPTALAAIAALGLGIFLVARRPDGPLVKKVQKLLCQLQLALRARPQPRFLIAAFCWFLVLGIFNGIGFQVLLRAFTPDVPSLATTIGINALGWLVGFFAIFSPGGLGVREGVMTALLAPLLPLDITVGAVVLWRVLQIVAEILCLAVCYAPHLMARLLGRPRRLVPIPPRAL